MAQASTNSNGAYIFLTGATGFVGKVVLEELVRRKAELGVAGIAILIRSKTSASGRTTTARDRFRTGIAGSKLFDGFPSAWHEEIDVIDGDLEKPSCGIAEADLKTLVGRITHVIHCAASVEFDLPIAEAARANITSALQVLELARACPKLIGMTSVSTAYVTPWRKAPILEELAHLPRPAEELFEAIISGSRSEADLLKETGHPNTYTYTKCLAEHMLSQRRGDVPLQIVRPSIIAGAWNHRIPGWIDSTAAYTGCLMFLGMGMVKAWAADPSARADVVPVDVVSAVILETTFHKPYPAMGDATPIHYAAMGVENALHLGRSVQETTKFFQERPGAKSLPVGVFVGLHHHGFHERDLTKRELPTQFLRAMLTATKRERDRKKLDYVDEKARYIVSTFHYFTTRSFDFQPKVSAVPPGFDPEKYIQLILHSMYKHLLKKDETAIPLAGRDHDDARGDLRWLMEKGPNATSPATRALGFALRKTMRKCTQLISFDRPSFERAVAAAPADALFALLPSHRSYFDFLLMSYLCFQHPELGIPMPFIAAAEEFSKIPVASKVIAESQAFFVKRGQGKADPEVAAELNRIAERGGSIMFFVEGQRSRSRHFLQPKRGLLRGLQNTGRTFALLPIAMSYDRLPEEQALERELTGGRRSKMSLKAIMAWLGRLARGEEQMGRVHISCGAPIVLNPESDIPELATRILAEQQAHTSVSTFHLRSFIKEAGVDLDEKWLANAITERGGRVLTSSLEAPETISPVLRQSLRNQWMHWFYGDARAMYPDSTVVQDHVARHAWTQVTPAGDLEDPSLRKLIDALMAPIAEDYALTARGLGTPAAPPVCTTPMAVVTANPAAHLPHVEDAFSAMADRGILTQTDGTFTWGPNANELARFRGECAGWRTQTPSPLTTATTAAVSNEVLS